MKLGHQMPVDATAARVISPGEHFEYRHLASEVCSDVPLPVVPEQFDDLPLRGARFGRLTVLGRWNAPRNRWVCRCSCGNYVLRKAAAVRQAAPDSACAKCYLLAVSKRKDFIRRTGKERHTREFM